jgi:hypothetical protein
VRSRVPVRLQERAQRGCVCVVWWPVDVAARRPARSEEYRDGLQSVLSCPQSCHIAPKPTPCVRKREWMTPRKAGRSFRGFGTSRPTKLHSVRSLQAVLNPNSRQFACKRHTEMWESNGAKLFNAPTLRHGSKKTTPSQDNNCDRVIAGCQVSCAAQSTPLRSVALHWACSWGGPPPSSCDTLRTSRIRPSNVATATR